MRFVCISAGKSMPGWCPWASSQMLVLALSVCPGWSRLPCHLSLLVRLLLLLGTGNVSGAGYYRQDACEVAKITLFFPSKLNIFAPAPCTGITPSYLCWNSLSLSELAKTEILQDITPWGEMRQKSSISQAEGWTPKPAQEMPPSGSKGGPQK